MVFRQTSSAGLVLCCVLAAVGCRAQIKVKTQHSAPAPLGPATGIGAPVEIADGLGPTRQYFQSRSVIVINVATKEVAPGDDISLVDDTTGASLVTHQPLAMGLASDAAAVYLADTPYDITIRLYPALPDYAGHFAFGANKLRLVVNDSVKPRFAQSTVYLRDFPYFAVATAAFAENRQQLGGLQGSVDHVLSNIVTNGVGTLTTGIIATLNR